MVRQKTVESKTPSKVASVAAVFALALPLYAGCVNKATTPPASQAASQKVQMEQKKETLTVRTGDSVRLRFALHEHSFELEVRKVDDEGVELSIAMAVGGRRDVTGARSYGMRIDYGERELTEEFFPITFAVKAEKGKLPGTATVTIEESAIKYDQEKKRQHAILKLAAFEAIDQRNIRIKNGIEGKIKFDCFENVEDVRSSGLIGLKVGERLRIGDAELMALPDAGVLVTYRGEKDLVFLGVDRSCKISVSRKDIAKVHCPGCRSKTCIFVKKLNAENQVK